MPQDSLDRIREALTRLPTCNRAELNAEWLRLYRTKPPARLGRNRRARAGRRVADPGAGLSAPARAALRARPKPSNGPG
jgi:hypothetical protein